MIIQPKVAKKTIETLNDFYGHVYRLSPGVMFLILSILLKINKTKFFKFIEFKI